MRIVFLSPSGQLGGAEVCLLDMVAMLCRSQPGWKVFVIVAENGPIIERARALGADVILLPFPERLATVGDSSPDRIQASSFQLLMTASAAMSYRDRLYGHLRRIQPMVVHSNGFKMHVLGALAKPHAARLVWHMHDYLSTRSFMRRLLRPLASWADDIVAVSESVANDVRTVTGSSRVTMILNAVDLEEFTPKGRAIALDDACGLPVAPPLTVRIGLVATMAWWKGHRIFVEAMSKVDRRLPVRGYVIGGALYGTRSEQQSVDELKKYAVQLGIADRIGFTGFVKRPAEAMRALDVVVHASTAPEPFGRVIVEAMACSKPVISSGIGGAAEILKTGDFARRFDGSASSLGESISALVAEPQERVRLGANGLDLARAHFSRQRLGGQLALLYEDAPVESLNGLTVATAS